jgi:hypothetical protein
MQTIQRLTLLAAAALLLSACEPEVGSDDWCQMMKEKSAADITAAEAADMAKHCIL